jgi:hypothetical protein
MNLYAANNLWFDEVQYWQQLNHQRPDIIADPATCYDALTLKPRLRDQVLFGTATPQQIIVANYTARQKKIDLAWNQRQQDALVEEGNKLLMRLAASGTDVSGVSANNPSDNQFRRMMAKGMIEGLFAFAPAGYSIDQFVGYQTMAGRVADDRGLDYKVFFEFPHVIHDLTPARYRRFSAALAGGGFQGDSKTTTNQNTPWINRFQYNNLIVHSHSMADAERAESVGMQVFGKEVVHMSRGVDVMVRASGTNIVGTTQSYDWHGFLCTGDFILLPSDVRTFVETAPTP